MAIRRYKLAIDNHPAAGYATIDDIQGSGEFFVDIGWKPQAATVSFAKQYVLPPEFIPYEGSHLYLLVQDAPLSRTYDILDFTSIAGFPGVPTSLGVNQYTNLFYFDFLSGTNSYFVNPNSWNMFSSGATASADKISLNVADFAPVQFLFLISNPLDVVKGDLLYFGSGADVSATYGLPPLTKFEIIGGVEALTDIAEMIFVKGEQWVGDIYDYYYHYGTGSYDLTVEDGTLYIQFNSPLDPDWPYFFLIFNKFPQPEIKVRYENDPFEENGFWVVYNNLPKGILRFNYYVR